jgi:hypothetical protein
MADPVPERPGGLGGPGPHYARLIEPDRVHGSLYTDPRVFADELPEGHLTRLLDPSADRWRVA